MEKMMYVKIAVLILGFCSSLTCVRGQKRQRTDGTSTEPAARTKVSSRGSVDTALGIGEDEGPAAMDTSDDGVAGDAPVQLQALIDQLGESTDKIIASLTGVVNTLGASSNAASETTDGLASTVEELSKDVQVASGTASTVIAVTGATS